MFSVTERVLALQWGSIFMVKNSSNVAFTELFCLTANDNDICGSVFASFISTCVCKYWKMVGFFLIGLFVFLPMPYAKLSWIYVKMHRKKLLILPCSLSCWDWKMWAMGDGERGDRCVEDVQIQRVRGLALCVLSPAELLYILKTIFYSV